MKIIYRLGDMFASNETCLIHGCNALGVMGSGVARAIRDRHPAAYEAYRDAYEVSGELRVGDVIWATSKGVLIGNAITQAKYGNDKRMVYADYDGIREAMQAVNNKVAGIHSTVGMPQIGAGLANGDWRIISQIIEEESKSFTPVVYILDRRLYDAAVNMAANLTTTSSVTLAE